MITVSLIGAGKPAIALFKSLLTVKGVKVEQWYNRSLNKINSFKNNVDITDDLSNLRKADFYLLSVSDDAVSEISANLPFKNQLVAHMSGSVSIHELNKKNNRAVFYPLQTFSDQSEIDFKDAPVCIEALDKKDGSFLMDFAKHLGCKAYKINTDQRFRLHLAAVFVNNFVNQLYRIGHELCDEKKIPFDILKPLILETAKKIDCMSPFQAQTGPAMRGDKKTIKKHLKQLDKEQHRMIYQLLTKTIKTTHGR